MTRIKLLNVYILNGDLPERDTRYHVLLALRKLKHTFRDKLHHTWISDSLGADYQIFDWPNYEAELTEFSKKLTCVRLFVRIYDSLEITKGMKL